MGDYTGQKGFLFDSFRFSEKDSRTADDLLKEAKSFKREDRPSVHFNVPEDRAGACPC